MIRTGADEEVMVIKSGRQQKCSNRGRKVVDETERERERAVCWGCERGQKRHRRGPRFSRAGCELKIARQLVKKGKRWQTERVNWSDRVKAGYSTVRQLTRAWCWNIQLA
jgi:hypothetical protein